MTPPLTDSLAAAAPAAVPPPAAARAVRPPSPPAVAAPPRPFQLATLAPLRPAVTLGLGLPSHVSGLPAFYYWKDAIVVGSYVHPTGRFSLDVTRDKLDAYVNTFARMRANGVGVPILMDHAPSAAATLGWIVDVKRRGDRLLELHQFLGESARDVGLRNFVSLGIDPNFVDGRGVHYGEAIVHSAVTPTPVVPGQAEFEPAIEAAPHGADELAMITLSLAERGEPVSPTAADASPAAPQFRPAPAEGVHDESGDLAPPAAPPQDQTPPPAPPQDQTPPAPQPLAPPAAPPQIEPPVVVPSDLAAPTLNLALTALADAAAAKRDLAVARGGIAPAVADELFALLVRSDDGALNVMALSRASAVGPAGAPAPLALAVFDALTRNQPMPLGEATQPQVLSRLVPGEDDERLELRDRMIALASARR